MKKKNNEYLLIFLTIRYYQVKGTFVASQGI